MRNCSVHYQYDLEHCWSVDSIFAQFLCSLYLHCILLCQHCVVLFVVILLPIFECCYINLVTYLFSLLFVAYWIVIIIVVVSV